MGYPSQGNHNPESVDISGAATDLCRMNSQTFGDVLRFWMTKENVTQDKLAVACDVSQAYISMLLKNKKNPSMPLMEKVISFFQTDISEFFRQPSCIFDDFALVPMLSARPKAGGGGLETDAGFTGWYTFRRNFLDRKGDALSMYLFRVVGDSMESTLMENDVVLIDTSQSTSVNRWFSWITSNTGLSEPPLPSLWRSPAPSSASCKSKTPGSSTR